MERVVYSLREVSQMVGVTEKNLRARVERGTLPAVRFGRSVMIPATYIDSLREPSEVAA